MKSSRLTQLRIILALESIDWGFCKRLSKPDQPRAAKRRPLFFRRYQCRIFYKSYKWIIQLMDTGHNCSWKLINLNYTLDFIIEGWRGGTWTIKPRPWNLFLFHLLWFELVSLHHLWWLVIKHLQHIETLLSYKDCNRRPSCWYVLRLCERKLPSIPLGGGSQRLSSKKGKPLLLEQRMYKLLSW